jgi:hypothetical protein
MNFAEFEASIPNLRPSSPAWRASIKALYGDPLDSEELEIFRRLSGREPHEGGYTEALFCGGRRSGKSEEMSRIAVFEAIHGGHGAALAKGQLGIVAIIGAERAQALEIIRYASGLVNSTPALKKKLAPGGDLVESITFKSGIVIKVLSANSTSVRSGTIVCAILEESAFLPWSGADTDVEIVEALKPGLTPLIGAPPRRLIAISSAGPRIGWFFDTVTASLGNSASDTLAVLGTTLDFNENVDRDYLAKRRAANETVYLREYESIFSDVTVNGWFGADTLARAVDANRTEATAYELGLRYFIAVDLALDRDSTAIAVACSRFVFTDASRTQRKRRTDVVYTERLSPKPGQPLDINDVVSRVARVCNLYGTSQIYIDQWSSPTFAERDDLVVPAITPEA